MVVAAGSVARVTLLRLLGRVYRERGTYNLNVEHDGGRSIAYFRDGHPVGIHLFAKFRPLAQVMLQHGMIDMDVLEKALAEMSGGGRLFGQILLDMGAITREQLLVGLRRQHMHNLDTLLEVQEGSYQLLEGAEQPRWTEDVALSPQEVVMSFLGRPEHRPQVESLLKLLGGPVYTLTPLWEGEWLRFEISRPEFEALGTLGEQPATLEELAVERDLDLKRLECIVAAMSCFGLIRAA